MGVSGSGKSTVAGSLARAMGCAFQEGDDLHPPENIAKMKAGVPLTDADRAPWLARIGAVLDGWRASGVSGVLACSALKRAYRDELMRGRPEVRLVYLRGDFGTIRDRVLARRGHFMPASLLESQFADLEEPEDDEHPIVIPIDQSLDALVVGLLNQLRTENR